MILSAFFFALVGVGVKLAGPDVGVWQVSFYRAVWGILIILGMAAVFRIKFLGPNISLLLIRGVSGTAGFLCMVVALRDIPMAEVMVLFYIFPAFAALFSPWLNDERVSGRQWLMVGLAFAGTVVILAHGGVHQIRIGHLAALGTAVLAGLNTALVRRLSGEHSPYCIYFFFCLAATAVSGGGLLAGHEALIPSARGLAYLALIGVAATAGQVLMNKGFVHLPAAEGGVVLMSQVLIAAAWGVLFFGEPLTWRLAIGGGLIMAGGAGLSQAGRSKAAQDAAATERT